MHFAARAKTVTALHRCPLFGFALRRAYSPCLKRHWRRKSTCSIAKNSLAKATQMAQTRAFRSNNIQVKESA